jgi:integrase
MATIRQIRGKWQTIVRRKGYPNQSKTFDLRKDAERWGRHQERLIDAGEWVNRTEAQQTTLWELLDRYGKEISATKRGSRAELNRLEMFKRSILAKLSVAAITGQRVAEWRDLRLKEVSSGTVLRELQLLGHVFAVAIREWGIALHGNPVSLISKPAPGKARDRTLSDAERSALIAACDKCQNPWVKPVVVFALETGARRGEILSLRWVDVDLQYCTAKVDGKTGPRAIPLSTACTALLKVIPRSVDGRVFPVTVEALKQAYERAVVRAGISNFTFHDLRHDALTRLGRLGLNVLELRAISGHATANMLQRYVSIKAEDLAVKLSRMA